MSAAPTLDSGLAEPDFRYICDVVRREAAIVLEPGKEYLVENRLQPVAKRHGLADVTELVGRLRIGDTTMLGAVVDALTTNETSFFRDGHPWDSMRDHVLPELFEKRQATKTINIWFAAASSGQEPYTLAMILRQHFATELESYRVRMIGTDISPSMIERCRQGRFSQIEVNRGLPARLLMEYFERDGISYVIAPELRSMIEFDELNLSTPHSWGWLPTFDLIFVRNVLIYFDVETKGRILENMVRQMAPDGSLFLGSTETTINITDALIPVQVGPSTCYRNAKELSR